MFWKRLGLGILLMLATMLASSCEDVIEKEQAKYPPGAPSNLVATPLDSSVQISWDNVAGATQYTLYMDIVSPVTKATATAIPGVATPFTVPSLANGTPYFFAVTASNAKGESGLSAEVTATPVPGVPPPLPSAPGAVTPTAGDSQVSLTWGVATDAVTYNVYWDTTPGFALPGTGSQTGIGTTSFNVTALTNGTTYYFKVTGVNGTGEGPAAAEVSATPAAALPSVPGAVTTTPGDTQVSLSWGVATGATTYNVYWDTTPGFALPGTGSQTGVGTTSFNVTALTNGTTYYFKVTGVNGTGEGPAAAEVSATPAAALPSAPGTVTPTAGNTQVALTWGAATGATTYTVYWSTTPGFALPGLGSQAGIGTTSFNVTALTNGTTYYFKVTGVNGTGEGPTTAEVSATPMPPATPTGVSAVTTGTTIDVSWSAVTGATQYRLYRRLNDPLVNSGDTIYQTITAPTVTFADTALPYGTTYHYVVTAFDGTGPSADSVVVNAITVPAAPTAPSATPGDGSMSVGWTPPPTATSYKIYWSISNPNPGPPPAPDTQQLTGILSPPYGHSPIPNYVRHFYAIAAINAGGEGPVSPVVNDLPVVSAPPCPAYLSTLDAYVNAGPLSCSLAPATIGTFFLNVTAGTTYEIYLRMDPASAGDVDLYTRDSALTPLEESWQNAPYDERVILNVTTPDTYDIDIDEWTGSGPVNFLIEIKSYPTQPAGILPTDECSALNFTGDICGGGVLVRQEQAGMSGVMLVSTDAWVDSIPYKTVLSPTANARDFVDGRNNVGTFNATHPASDYCQTLVLNGFSDWYLPANWELYQLEESVQLGNLIGLPDGGPNYYWSSTQDNEVIPDPTQAYQAVFNGVPDNTYIVFAKNSATLIDFVTCVRRPAL